MFKKFGPKIELASWPARGPSRIFYLVLLFALLIGSISQITPVSAAPTQGQVTPVLAVYLPDPPICVGKDYPIQARVVVTWPTGVGDGVVARGILGVNIEAFAQDESIGAISPSSRLAFDVEAADFELGTVTFNFHAKKAGTTTLFFETQARGQYLATNKTIKVVNCEYKVTMNAFWGYFGDVQIWTSGLMTTKISGDGYQMQGSGRLSFISGFVGPPCSISYSGYENPVTITGILDEGRDNLTLNFQYLPGTVTSSVSCPDGGGAGSREVDLTKTGLTSATFPARGGSRTFRVNYAGSDSPATTITITVTPVEAGE